jgi:hypothetical protein
MAFQGHRLVLFSAISMKFALSCTVRSKKIKKELILGGARGTRQRELVQEGW